MNEANCKFMAAEIGEKLAGRTITGAVLSSDGEGFGFRVDNGEEGGSAVVWVDCDPEGNGPGWLSIEAE